MRKKKSTLNPHNIIYCSLAFVKPNLKKVKKSLSSFVVSCGKRLYTYKKGGRLYGNISKKIPFAH